MPVSISGVGVREKLFEVLPHDLARVPAEVAVAASLTGSGGHALWALPGALFFLKRLDRIHASDLAAAKRLQP